MSSHGWSEVKDPKSGKTYYYHKATKKTQWTRPPEMDEVNGDDKPEDKPTKEDKPKKGSDDDEDVKPKKSEDKPKSDNPEDDPANWSEVTDKNTGRTYYYCKPTKKTSWKKPACMDGGAGGDKPKDEPKKDEPKKASKKSSDDDEDEKPKKEEPKKTEDKPKSDNPEDDPANWSEVTDKNTGRTYYYCKQTKKTSWKKPACMEGGAGGDKPKDEPKKAEPKKEEAKKEEPKKKDSDDDDSEDDRILAGKPTPKPKAEEPKKVPVKAAKDSDDSDDDDKDKGKKDAGKGGKKGSDSEDDDDSDDGKKKPEPKKADSAKKEDAKKGAEKPKKKGSDSEDDDKGDKDKNKKAQTDQVMNMKKQMNASAVEETRKKAGDDDDDADAPEFKFAKHRHGFFNRVFRLGDGFDEAKLLSYKKSMIKKALLKMNRDLDAEAVQNFKNVMSYMGDRKSSKQPAEHAKKMLRNLMIAPAGLRDEAFMQVCKQTTQNPKMESTVKGWELMIFQLATFPPSKHLKTFLTDYIDKNAKEASNSKIQEMAKICQSRLPTITVMGQRKQVPSALELECLRELKPVPLRVNLVNGTFKTFNVDPYTLVQDVQDQLVQKFNLTVSSPFALYEAAEANVERILDPKDRVLDVYASWENKPLMEEVKDEDKAAPTKKKDAAKSQQLKEEVKTEKKNSYNSFLYKAKLVLKTTNKEIMSDPECVNLIYLQAVSDVVTSRYPANEKDVTVLAALQLQATHGDFKKDVHVPGWLTPKLSEFMPRDLLMKKGKASSKLEKEWEQMILAKYAKVSGFTSLEAKLNYLDYVQEWVFYGATFFTVEQRQFKDYPSPLTLGINCEGVLLMHPEKKTVLENYQYTDIVTWGHSDEKFIVVVGNIVQQRKLIFKTPDGKAMNHLIHDYVKFKVKNK